MTTNHQSRWDHRNYLRAALYAGADERDRAEDAREAERWHSGTLSPRQAAGFYEVPPALAGPRLAAYRAALKQIDRYARWRRAHPRPDDKHLVYVEEASKKVVGILADGLMPAAWSRYYEAVRVYEAMTKRQRAKAGEPKRPPGPKPERHDTFYLRYSYREGARPDCPLCRCWQDEDKRWIAAHAAAIERITGEAISDRSSWQGGAPAQWPDGSWGCYLSYPPLPIRSARAVARVRPKSKTA